MDDALWARAAEAVSRRMGLSFPPGRRDDLRRGVSAAANELGFGDAEACAHWIASGLPTAGELHALAAHLTIGETYFFRDGSSYDAFIERVVPEIVRAHRDTDRRIRIWSAGCCTGEEPYSLAMALHQSLPDLREWDVAILATDINPRFLEKAAAGIYGEWSFRGEARHARELYFERTPEGRYAVRPEVKRLVRFARMNLAEDAYPSAANGTHALDVIFCRNVLMYFSADAMRRVIDRMHAALVPGGWLSVSPSEATHVHFPQFVPAGRGGALFYRKEARRAARKPPVVREPAADTAVEPRPVVPPPGLQRRTPEPAVARAQEVPPNAVSCAARARAHADLGELDAALQWCDRWTDADKLAPAGHYLRALVLSEMGDIDEAKAALQRLLFLEPHFVLAHYALGNLASMTGERGEARRHFVNTLRLLERCEAGDLVPESDGVTAGRLSETVAAIVEAMPDHG